MNEHPEPTVTPEKPEEGRFGLVNLVMKTPVPHIIARASDLTIRLANPAVTELLGWTADDLLGQPVNILIPDEFQELHNAGVERWHETGRQHFIDSKLPLHVTAKRKDGGLEPVSITLFRIGPFPEATNQFLVAAVITREQPIAPLEPEEEAQEEEAEDTAQRILRRLPPFNVSIMIKLFALAWIFWFMAPHSTQLAGIMERVAPLRAWSVLLCVLSLGELALILKNNVWMCRIVSFVMTFWWMFLGVTIYATDHKAIPLAVYFGANSIGSVLTLFGACITPAPPIWKRRARL